MFKDDECQYEEKTLKLRTSRENAADAAELVGLSNGVNVSRPRNFMKSEWLLHHGRTTGHSQVFSNSFETLVRSSNPTAPSMQSADSIKTQQLLFNASLKGSFRSFYPRARFQARHGPTLSLLKRILSSYPRMLQGAGIPPFVHHLQLQPFLVIQSLPEALLNCQALLDLFYSPEASKRSSAWRLIRIEQERIWFENQDFDDWQLLAALQALLVYTLLRMIQGPVAENDFDLPLLVSINNIATLLVKRVGWLQLFDSGLSFDEWIFKEARRRTVIMFGIVNLMINVSDAVACTPPAGFAIIPLPSNDKLWQARSSSQWQETYRDSTAEQVNYALSMDGRLMKLYRNIDRYSTEAVEWDEWCSEHGDIGNLIATTALLLE